MTDRVRVLAYKQGSASARALADGLDALMLRRDGSTFRPRADDLIVNWGSQRKMNLEPARVLNDPEAIRIASDKLEFFETMSSSDETRMLVPKHWTDASEIEDSEFSIVCRTVLSGHSGQGIVIARDRSELVPAPLYVKYMKKKDEYRVHVGRVEGRKNPDMVIAVQRKAREIAVPDSEVNWEIRNHSNGFVFVRNGFTAPVAVVDAARQVFSATGLDFGAVDVIYNERSAAAYVLEVNTAPGMEGRTVEDYVRFIEKVGNPNTAVTDHAMEEA